jgi:hypothetical protein
MLASLKEMIVQRTLYNQVPICAKDNNTQGNQRCCDIMNGGKDSLRIFDIGRNPTRWSRYPRKRFFM